MAAWALVLVSVVALAVAPVVAVPLALLAALAAHTLDVRAARNVAFVLALAAAVLLLFLGIGGDVNGGLVD